MSRFRPRRSWRRPSWAGQLPPDGSHCSAAPTSGRSAAASSGTARSRTTPRIVLASDPRRSRDRRAPRTRADPLSGAASRPSPGQSSTSSSTLCFVSLIVLFRAGRPIREFLTRAETSNIWANLLTLAPLGWLMARLYEMPGWRCVDDASLRSSPLHDAARVPAVRRDARDVHADDRGAGGGGGQARPVHEQALAAGAHDLGRYRAADARVGGGAGGARVGRPAPRRRQDRRAGQHPAEAGQADPRGADHDERPPGARARRSSGRSSAWRPSCRSSGITTSGTTARATPTG